MVAAVRLKKVLAAAACGALLGLLGPARASAQAATYAGTYKASPTTVIAEVSAWGEDCGVRPTSQTLPEQPIVEVRDVGNQLELKFPDRVLRSNGCWSQNPAVKPTASAHAGYAWRAECATSQGDSKRELGRYTITATAPTTLELREESEYLWQLKNSRCTAKVRTVQRLERIPDGQAAPPPPPEVTPEPCVPGPLTRIKIRPHDAQIQPGQRVCFAVRGFDAKGCAQELEASGVNWSLEKADALRGTLSGGCFRASERTAEAEGVFRVNASREGKRDQVTVTVAIADLSDITARRDQAGFNALPTEESAEGGLAGAGVKAVGVESETGAGLALAGLAAVLVLASLGGWLWSRRQGSPSPSPVGPSPTPAQVPGATPAPSPKPARPAEQTAPAAAPVAPSAPAVVGGEQMICPQCRRGHPPGSERCQSDGARLVAYSAFVQQSKASEARACRGCGQRLDADAVFCGSCGKRV